MGFETVVVRYCLCTMAERLGTDGKGKGESRGEEAVLSELGYVEDGDAFLRAVSPKPETRSPKPETLTPTGRIRQRLVAVTHATPCCVRRCVG